MAGEFKVEIRRRATASIAVVRGDERTQVAQRWQHSSEILVRTTRWEVGDTVNDAEKELKSENRTRTVASIDNAAL